MNFKLAILAAAAVGAATTAQAADLAKKAPAAANYVKVCDAYGAGFFYIPGSETCLKIGGYVRVDFVGGGGTEGWRDYGSNRSENALSTGFRAEIDVDARTATEMGLLRSFIALRSDGGSFAMSASKQNAYVDKAFIQFGGLTAGYATSFFDFFTGASVEWYEPNWSDSSTNLLAYTFSFGNGVTATLSIEDPTARRLGTYYGGVKMPDIVGNVNVTQAWGSAQLSAAYHQNYALSSVYGDKSGWAVQLGTKINLPSLGADDYLALQGGYSKGAVSYMSTNGLVADFIGLGTSIEQSDVWQIGLGFHHAFTKTVSFDLDAGYAKFDSPKDAWYKDFSSVVVAGDVVWAPVAGLSIIPHAAYINESKAPSLGKEANKWVAGLRIKRNF